MRGKISNQTKLYLIPSHHILFSASVKELCSSADFDQARKPASSSTRSIKDSSPDETVQIQREALLKFERDTLEAGLGLAH